MLLPTMTPEEIYAEIAKDKFWLIERIGKKFAPLYGKRAKRLSKFPDIYPYADISKITNIEYHFFFITYSRGQWDKPIMLVTTQYPWENGRTFIYIEVIEKFAIRIYTSHFMKRYGEREKDLCEKYKSVSGISMEYFYIFRNRDVEEMKFFDEFVENHIDDIDIEKYNKQTKSTKFWQDPDYDRFVVACFSGVCLCERHKKNPYITIYDTYLSLNMLKPDQMINWVLAYTRIFFTKLEFQYPRQKAHWSKMWLDINKIVENEVEPGGIIASIMVGLDTINEKYPVRDVI